MTGRRPSALLFAEGAILRCFFREKTTESGGAAGNEEGADLKKLGEKRRKNKTPTT